MIWTQIISGRGIVSSAMNAVLGCATLSVVQDGLDHRGRCLGSLAHVRGSTHRMRVGKSLSGSIHLQTELMHVNSPEARSRN